MSSCSARGHSSGASGSHGSCAGAVPDSSSLCGSGSCFVCWLWAVSAVRFASGSVRKAQFHSHLPCKLEILSSSCLQATSSTGNRFYRQEVPCSESIQNPFRFHLEFIRIHAQFIQNPFRIHSGSIQNSFEKHSECVPNSCRICSGLILNSSRIHSDLMQNSCITHSELIQNSFLNSFKTLSDRVYNSFQKSFLNSFRTHF